MRAAYISAIILVLIGILAGAVAVFYFLAALGGVAALSLAKALGFAGQASYGVALVNALTLLLGFVMILASMLTLAERKWSALMQDRIGPNRARLSIIPGVRNLSLAGLPHFMADGLKMLTKEDFIPGQGARVLHGLAPMLAFAPVFALFAVVQVSPAIAASAIPGVGAIAEALGVRASFPVSLQVIPNLDIGLLYLFALASLAVYGTALAGWASNNKFALLGGVRAASQMIAYEVALGLSLVGAMMAYQTLRLEGMAAAQGPWLFSGLVPQWGLFLQPIGFILFFAAAFAETKRAPFDMPEGEAEIIGYFVEYSGMRFGLFMISEFVEIVVLSGVIAVIFLGGFHLPFPPSWGIEGMLSGISPFLLAVVYGLSFVLKLVALCWVQLAIRWTMPRFRYDQIQTLGWKILLPLGIANVFITGALILLDPTFELLAIVGIFELAILIGITLLYPRRAPVSIRNRTPASATAAHGH